MSGEHETRVVAHVDECTQCQLMLDSLQVAATEWIKSAAISSPTTISPSLTTRLDKIKLDRAGLIGNDADSPVSRFQDMTPWFDPVEDSEQTSRHEQILGRIAEFDLLEMIGRGGMGAVFRAFDRKLERTVALKLMSPSLLADPTSSQRFLREARSAAGINHPNAVAVHSVDEIRGLPYLVMEFVEGESLYDLLKRNPKPSLEVSLSIVEQLADGLAAAHKTGVIHRDVKPANILIESQSKTIKLTDFGLARTANNSLTSTGLLMGTPEFLAPEQLTTQEVDHRVDLFSLGTVFYLLCSGKVPFDGPSANVVMNQISNSTPTPIQDMVPGFPDAISDLIDQLLQKNPNQRPADAVQVSRAIRAIREGSRFDTQPAISTKGKAAIPAKRGLPIKWLFAAVIPVLAWLGWSFVISPNLEKASGPKSGSAMVESFEQNQQILKSEPAIVLKSSDEWIEYFESLDSYRLAKDLNIQLASNEEFMVEPIEIETHSVSVTAAEGFKPKVVFQLEEPGPCVLVEEGKLFLDGIDINVDVSDVEEPDLDEEEEELITSIVQCVDGKVRLNNCRLVSDAAICLHLEDVDCVVDSSELLSGECAGIHFSTVGEGLLVIQNCLLAGAENLSIGVVEACSIELNKNTLVGELSITFYLEHPDPDQVEIRARNNVFDSGNCMMMFGENGPEDAAEIKEVLNWIGNSNLLPETVVRCMSDLDENLIEDESQLSDLNIVENDSATAEPSYRIGKDKVRAKANEGTLRVSDVELTGEEQSGKYGVGS